MGWQSTPIRTQFPVRLTDTLTHPSTFSIERPFGANLLDAHGTWIHESSNLGATFAAGGADAIHHTLNTLRIDSTYHWTSKYTATGALFRTTGTTRPAAVCFRARDGEPQW